MAENDFRGNIELIVSNLQMLLTLETVIKLGDSNDSNKTSFMF